MTRTIEEMCAQRDPLYAAMQPQGDFRLALLNDKSMSYLGPYPLDSIITGDARELAQAIPDESVDLIFTDPVYWQIEDYAWLAETAARVLKVGGNLLCWQGTAHLPKALIELSRCLEYKWTFSMSHSNAMGGNIIFSLGVFTHWTPLLWFGKTDSKPKSKVRDWLDVPLIAGAIENHSWHKSIKGLAYWLQCFTDPAAIVFDPFTGGGTVPAVCKMLRRHYLAFEIDPDTAERARQRVLTTQAPLVFPEPEQLMMEV